MIRIFPSLSFRNIVAATITFLVAGSALGAEKRPPIGQPIPSVMKGWGPMHQFLCVRVVQASKKPPMDIYFLGDSLTEYWPQVAKEHWEKEFGQLQVLNCGVAGDTVQNVLYRITHGEFDGIHPKVIVLLAGINNLGIYPDLPPEELVQGTKAILTILKAKSPESKILLLGLFPAGANPAHPVRSRILQTNRLLAEFADNKTVFYLDLYDRFVDKEGRMLPDISPDELHLNAKGYQIWADNMRPELNKLLHPAEKP